MGENFEKIKVAIKTAIKTTTKPIIITVAIIITIIIIIAGATYLIKKDDASHKDNDWSNTPYAAEQYSSDITIGENGEITTSMTAQELWDKMIENGSRVDEYLDKPEELLKLMNAQNVTNFLDTRENPEEEIDWEKINKSVDDKTIQGIVKMKRAGTDGKTTTMTYISPEKLQELIDKYNESGSEEAKKEAMKHFTLKKGTGGSGSSSTSDNEGSGNLESLDGVLFIGDSYTEELVKKLPNSIVKAKIGASAIYWLDDANFSTLPENDDKVKAVCVLLGVNNPDTISQMKDLIKKLTEKYQGKTVYVQKVFPVASGYTDEYGNNAEKLNKKIDEYNKQIKEYSSTLSNVKYIDTTSGYVDSSGKAIDSKYSGSLHLADYNQWVENIKNKLVKKSTTSAETTNTELKTNEISSASTKTNETTNTISTNSQATNETSGNSQANQESPFTKFIFENEDQLKSVAVVCQSEQGTAKGAAAEASLMANHMDLNTGSAKNYPDTGEGLYNYVKKSGWFYQAKTYMDDKPFHTHPDNGSEPLRDDVLEAVRAVLVDGKRTLPGYIDQHDCKSDIGSISTGNKKNNSDYKQHETIVYQNDRIASKDHWTFYSFPDDGHSDPFGYSDQAAKRRSEIGEFCYDFDTGLGSGSSGTGGSSSSIYAVVATWSESTSSLTSNDPDVEGYDNPTTYTMTTENLDFQNALKAYQMPFDYLWALTVIGGNKDFPLELADLVENSELEITVHDNLTVTKTVETKEYTKKTRVVTKDIIIAVDLEDEDGKTRPTRYYGPYEGKGTIEKSYKTVNTTLTKTNTLEVVVTRANIWTVDYKQEYTYQEPETEENDSESEINEEEPEDPEKTDDEDPCDIAEKYVDEIEEKYDDNESYDNFSVDVSIDSLESEYYSSVKGKQSIHTTTETTKYISSPAETIEKTDKKAEEPNFVSIISKNEHTEARDSILSGAEWLFEILEENKNTSDMVDLTKYLLYKVSGVAFDNVTEFDFEGVFKPGSFKTMDGVNNALDLLKEYIRYFENSKGAPTNAAGTCYIIETDGAGHPTVGYGVDIFNGGFAELFKQAGYPTEIGGEVPIEFVDALEDQEIQNCLEKIRAATSGLNLKEYQIHALVSRAYNCGVGSLSASGKAGAIGIRNGKNFVEAYKAFWNEEVDDLYEKNATEGNFNHSLYTQYMNKPVTSEGKYMKGLETRRKSEWTLFQTGYYDVLGKRYQEGGGTIIQVADRIHKYMEQNNYTYCVYGGNKSEECKGGGHGLNTTFEKSKTGYHHSCCANYVSWVLQEAGCITEADHEDSANELREKLIKKGWIKVNSVSELQPGDVVCYNHHVEIYAGNNTVYNAGSGGAIRGSSPHQKNVGKMMFGLRAPNQK